MIHRGLQQRRSHQRRDSSSEGQGPASDSDEEEWGLPELGPGDRPRLHLGPDESAGIHFAFEGRRLVVTGYVDEGSRWRAEKAGARVGRSLVSVNGMTVTGTKAAILARLNQVHAVRRQLGFGDPPREEKKPTTKFLLPKTTIGPSTSVPVDPPEELAHDDPFSTPARRRRITFAVATSAEIKFEFRDDFIFIF